MKSIDEWWPLLHEQVRRTLVNGIWMPVSAFSRAEIERLGGPGADDEYWQGRDDDYRLPQAAVQWIIASPDFKEFLEPVRPDPRAAYFRGTWPRRRC